MRVLLTYPNIHGMNMLPPAIGLFTSLLRCQGHTVDLFDSTNWIIPEEEFDSDKEKEKILTVRPFDDTKLWSEVRRSDVGVDFLAKVQSFGPDLIAFSVTEDIFPVAQLLLKHLRGLDIPVILGGVFATFAPEICLREPEVDMVCIGEGEAVMTELCRRLDLGQSYDDIPGLWVKGAQGIRKNPLGPPVDFSDNPRIDLSLFEESRLYRPMQGRIWRMLPVETHRGCPYQCTYCNSPAQQRLYHGETRKSFFRQKRFDAVHDELLYYKNDLKAEAFYFWADTFFAYTDRDFDAFCEIYQDIRLPFWCQSRPETLRHDRVRKLMDLGMFRMAFGIEHGNHEFRKTVLRRNVSNEVMVRNFAMLNELGLKYSVNNIMGFPTETRELAFDTIRLNRLVKADSANAYSFSPFHGTVLRKMSEELGYCDKDLIARSVMKPTLLNMPQFSPEAIEGLRRCFTLYVRMPEQYWDDIRQAESLSPEGDRIWNELREVCVSNYVNLE